MTMTPAVHSFEVLMPLPAGSAGYADTGLPPMLMRAAPAWADSNVTGPRREPSIRRRAMPSPVEIDRSEEDPERWDGLS